MSLTWYIKKSKRIMNDIKALKQEDIAIELNESQQTISYRINHVYPRMFEDVLRLLDLAGYEVKEREEDEEIRN